MRPDASSIENLLSAGADRDFFFSRKRKLFVATKETNAASSSRKREREIRSRRRVLIQSFAFEEKTRLKRQSSISSERDVERETRDGERRRCPEEASESFFFSFFFRAYYLGLQ